MNFYENVCTACENSNMSLSALLNKMNMSKSNIRNWRNGVIPKISVRTQISIITKTPIDFFLTDEEKELTKLITS